MQALHPADITVIVLYLVGITALGVWMARRVKRVSDFFMAWENLLSQFSLVMRRFHESLEKRGRTSRVRDLTIGAHTELFEAMRSGLPEEAETLARQHTTYWLSEFSKSKAFAPQLEE